MRHSCHAWLLATALAANASAETSDKPVVLDGDTLDLGHHHLRLYGIDAPELGQACGDASGADWPCGLAARDRLTALIATDDLTCFAVERDAAGQIGARCTAGGMDIAATLVAEGLAWADTRATSVYAEAEASARAGALGIWGGTAQTAWDWRNAGDWRPASGERDPADCTVPGAHPASGPDASPSDPDRSWGCGEDGAR